MGGHLEERSRLAYVLLGVCLVALMASATVVCVGMYRGSFTSTVPVTLYSARSGLMLEPGSDVKMRDVVVGRVSRVQLVDGRAEIAMDIDGDSPWVVDTLALAHTGPENAGHHHDEEEVL